MIIDEKGLLRAMKAEYKVLGYHVAAMGDAGKIKHIIITGKRWGVMMEKKSVPRKVLGLLAEHIGEIPTVNEGYKVRRGDIQTEIHENAMMTYRAFHKEDVQIGTVRRTGLTLNGYNLWQRGKDLRVAQVDPELESIALWKQDTAKLIGENVLMTEDLESRVYITVEKQDGHSSQLEHLSQFQWVAI